MHHHSGGHDLLLCAAAGVILAGPLLALIMDRWRAWIFLDTGASGIPAERVVGPALAILSVGAGAIHLAVFAEHYRAVPVAGSLLLAVGCFQLVWAARITASSRPLLDRAGLLVNFGTVVAWLASRTVGMPAPIGDGVAEPIGPSDLLATTLEFAIVAGLATRILASSWLSTAVVSARSGSLANLALAVSVLVLAGAAIGQGVPEHH